MKFTCWREGYEDESDAKLIENHTVAKSAAEEYAEAYCYRCCEFPSELTINVRADDGGLEQFEVSVESVPVFSARLVRDRKPA